MKNQIKANPSKNKTERITRNQNKQHKERRSRDRMREIKGETKANTNDRKKDESQNHLPVSGGADAGWSSNELDPILPEEYWGRTKKERKSKEKGYENNAKNEDIQKLRHQWRNHMVSQLLSCLVDSTMMHHSFVHAFLYVFILPLVIHTWCLR